MLMDFQIESGHAAQAQLVSEAAIPTHGRNSPTHEIRTFELAGSLWKAMFLFYGIFFTALFAATGRGAAAIFAIAISVGYTVMYFGTASMLNRVSAAERAKLPKVETSTGMQTNTGWMSNSAVNGQILVVPCSLAIFAVGFAIIRAFV